MDALFDAIPDDVVALCRRLREHERRGWVVGGCVRDLLRGAAAKDWDVATDARPEEVQDFFRKVIPTGIAHGTVTVLIRGRPYEVTTLRGEGEYVDGRRPEAVVFLDDIRDDLARRDFTFNAIALDPIERRLIDPFGGRDDLEAKILRAVGVPLERFTEDGLRVLRGARFAATLECKVDEATRAAMAHPNAHATLAKVSAERVHDEWLKSMRAPRPSIAFALMSELDVLAIHAPELAAVDDDELRWSATLDAVDRSVGVLGRLTALLHRLHPGDDSAAAKASAAQADALLKRLKFSNEHRSRAVHAIRHHAAPLTLDATDDVAVRRWLHDVTGERAPEALALLRARTQGSSDEARAEAFALRAESALAAGVPLATKDLAVKGGELIAALALPKGPEVGRLMAALVAHVIERPEDNDAERLVAVARRMREGP